MKLIVGLGNPGNKYKKTRHNVGFIAIDNYAKSKGILINKIKFDCLYGEYYHENEKIILLKPQNYINLSGEGIKKIMDFYKINVEDVLIICDDLNLELGILKLKRRGSSGGHNGLKNIELNLGTKDYKRLKIGISSNKDMDRSAYVLGKFTDNEYITIENIMKIVPNIIDDYLKLTFSNLMNKYNKK